MLVRMRQRVMRHQRSNMRKFSRFSSQEFLSRRNIEEEIANADCRARRSAGLFHLEQLAPCDLDASAGSVLRLSRFQYEPRNRSDRRQCLTAKAKRVNVQQIVCIVNL